MSEIKSIEKLREQAEREPLALTYILNDLADEIEAEWQDSYDAMCLEIERDYMKLPVDADGVPIHVGDICTKLDECFEVRQLRTDGDAWWTIDRLGESYMANFCHHFKPRTLEDVLRDFAKEVNVSSSDFISVDGEEAYMLAAINETADEIRELLGSDAE